MITITDKMTELRREYALRKRLYPGWIRKGTLNSFDAERQLKILEAIMGDYSKQTASEDLFARRLTASKIGGELLGILNIEVNDETQRRFFERVAKAVQEGA